MSYYQCQRCLFISKQKTGMIRHLDRKNKCIKNIQSYKYPDDVLYKMSLEMVKNNNNKLICNNINPIKNKCKNKCKYCFKCFSTKGNLNKHLNKHEDGSIPVYPEDYYKNQKNSITDSNIKEENSNNINQFKDFQSNVFEYEPEYIQIKEEDKNINQTINNITVNQQFNNYNIINMKYPNGFDKDWDLSQISYEKKLFLMNTCNTKYSELLKFILQNDDNLNIILENETNTGIVYKNDIEKYIHLNKSDIINQSLTKLKLQLNSLCDEILITNDNVQNIEKYQYEKLSINKKYDDYNKNNNNIKNSVQEIISDVFNEKKDKTIEIMNQIIENETNDNLLKNGF